MRLKLSSAPLIFQGIMLQIIFKKTKIKKTLIWSVVQNNIFVLIHFCIQLAKVIAKTGQLNNFWTLFHWLNLIRPCTKLSFKRDKLRLNMTMYLVQDKVFPTDKCICWMVGQLPFETFHCIFCPWINEESMKRSLAGHGYCYFLSKLKM